MQIPDFSNPGKDCFLTTDKNGVQLKVGDIVESFTMPLRGREKVWQTYSPVIEHDGHLVIPVGVQYKSHLVDCFVRSECSIVNPQP